MTTLVADHAVCREVLRRSGSSFSLPIRLLPPEKRRGTTALYAFCRRADDIVDDAPDAVTAAECLDSFEDECRRAFSGGGAEDPVVRAVTDTCRRFAVPERHLLDILAGVRMDLEARVYATFPELEEYCRRVSTAVGLAAIHVWGFTGRVPLRSAHACGLAFQLTNILRDVPEDLARGRIYLPAEDFEAHGCSIDDLRSGRMGPEFTSLAAFEIGRIRGFFRQAAHLDGALSTDGRIAFRAMFGAYRATLETVRRAGALVFCSRIRGWKPRLALAAVSAVLVGPRP